MLHVAGRFTIKLDLNSPFHSGAIGFVTPTVRLEKCPLDRVRIDVGGHCIRITSFYASSKDVFNAPGLRGIGYSRVCAVESGVDKLSKDSKVVSRE